MRQHIKKSHNVTMLLYHMVFPVKYRRKIFTTDNIENGLIKCCDEISKNYEVRFDTIGIDGDHVHFLVQGVPTLSVTKIVTMIKSFTGRYLLSFKKELSGKLWGGEIRTDGYYANTVGAVAGYQTIQNYVVNQGAGRKGYRTLYGGKDQAMKQPMLRTRGN